MESATTTLRATVVVAALGVVFGDIGTSPIYTIQAVFNPHDPHPVPVFAFRSSAGLAYAFGMAITGTIPITTTLFFYYAHARWRWRLGVVLFGGGALLAVDLMVVAANLTKLVHGAWLPLLIAITTFTVMITWQRGREIVARAWELAEGPLPEFVDGLVLIVSVETEPVPRIADADRMTPDDLGYSTTASSTWLRGSATWNAQMCREP